jgi:hypothetical protein
MPIIFIRKSLELPADEWAVLEALAEQHKTCPPSGPTAGQPSWRSLFKAIARGELAVVVKKK